MRRPSSALFFFFNDTATTEIYTLSLHDALPISFPVTLLVGPIKASQLYREDQIVYTSEARSEEHTSELQSHSDLVCRLLLEKKKKEKYRSDGHLERYRDRIRR